MAFLLAERCLHNHWCGTPQVRGSRFAEPGSADLLPVDPTLWDNLECVVTGGGEYNIVSHVKGVEQFDHSRVTNPTDYDVTFKGFATEGHMIYFNSVTFDFQST